jgi:hypothetical protein
VHPLR